LPVPLARLRLNLDFGPSPWPEHPGLFIRDPYHYSEAMLVIPPLLVEALQCFDGTQTDLDLRQALVRLTGDLNVSDIQKQLVEALSSAGFLEDENFAQMRDNRRLAFAQSPTRLPAHAGSAYPADAGDLREVLVTNLNGQDGAGSLRGPLLGLAAPHIALEGGWRSYQAAYSQLRPEDRDRTFVILGTSHFGAPQKFGLTRKTFSTPLGESITDQRLVDWLEVRGGDAVLMEDYCHSFEHTIEFQVLFLQHYLGPNLRILPILCGPFADSLLNGGNPEKDDQVHQFFDALGELGERESVKLCWVLGVDMAHMGARYSDPFTAAANQGLMTEVAARDRARIGCISAGDAAAFWELVRENRDDLKWCGSSPFYTFLKSLPRARGELLHYEQWNIDPKSVVSFAGMAFTEVD
jgi:AmmeMemoRadiSam system protein B